MARDEASYLTAEVFHSIGGSGGRNQNKLREEREERLRQFDWIFKELDSHAAAADDDDDDDDDDNEAQPSSKAAAAAADGDDDDDNEAQPSSKAAAANDDKLLAELEIIEAKGLDEWLLERAQS